MRNKRLSMHSLSSLYQTSRDTHSHRFSLIAGPCSIESYELFRQVAIEVKRSGATALRGGIFKLRTRHETFQGLGAEAIEIVQKVKHEVGLPFVSEITDPRQVEL